MALYITPFGRVTRRAWQRPTAKIYRDDNFAEVSYDVYVPVNVRVEDDSYVINALLPGVKAEDFSIQVLNETVTLQGEIKDTGSEQETYLLREQPTGRFYRVIRLPDGLDSNKADADLTDGVLTLRVPKVEEARPRTIKVQAK